MGLHAGGVNFIWRDQGGFLEEVCQGLGVGGYMGAVFSELLQKNPF